MSKIKEYFKNQKERKDNRRKLHILYCDDHQNFIDKFKSHHGGYFTIHSVTKITEVEKGIEEMKKKYKKSPDLILLDLYHPLDDVDTTEADNSLKDKLKPQIKETTEAYRDAYSPNGLYTLKSLRKSKYKKMPIAIYTQHGLSMLEDKKIGIVDEFRAHWIVKTKEDSAFEKLRIERIVDDELELRKDTRINQVLLVVSSLFSIGLIILMVVGKAGLALSKLANVSIVLNIFFLILKLIEYFHKILSRK